MKKLLYSLGIFFVLFLSACTTSDLEPSLEQIKNLDTSINTTEDLNGILKGALNRITQNNYYGRDFIITDEIRGMNVFANGSSGRFQTEAELNYIPSNNDGIWTRAYSAIGSANIIINADEEKLEGTADAIKHIKGQAYFLRALAHFDLLRQYGQQYAGGGTLGVPYITEFKGEDLFPSRNSVQEVKTNIYADLEKAYASMNSSTADKQYPTKHAAKALESRLALYFKEWDKAITAARAVISSNAYSIIPAADYVNSFKTDNTANSIFELAFDDVDNVGINGLGYIYRGDNYGDIEVLPLVEDIYSEDDVRADILGFEGDKLRNMGKFPDIQGSDNIVVLRLEEVVLNLAEALFEKGQKAEAITELNKITAARNATAYSGNITKEDILMERRKELIFEGFQFFDLSRNGLPIKKVSDLQNISATIPAGDYRYALPIPLTEMNANSNMEQNKNY